MVNGWGYNVNRAEQIWDILVTPPVTDGFTLTVNGQTDSVTIKTGERFSVNAIAPQNATVVSARQMGGGSVNPATGEFNFAVREGYMIRNGRIAEPVRRWRGLRRWSGGDLATAPGAAAVEGEARRCAAWRRT